MRGAQHLPPRRRTASGFYIRRSRASGLHPMTCDLFYSGERCCDALLGRIRVSLRRLRRPRTMPGRRSRCNFAASGSRPDAWTVLSTMPGEWSGLRPSAPVSSGGFRIAAHLVSEARSGKHIARAPSASACIHCEARKLIPTAQK